MFGGTVFEPMTDLIYLMGKLVDSQGKILIPHIYDSVPPVTEEERYAVSYSNDHVDTQPWI